QRLPRLFLPAPPERQQLADARRQGRVGRVQVHVLVPDDPAGPRPLPGPDGHPTHVGVPFAKLGLQPASGRSRSSPGLRGPGYRGRGRGARGRRVGSGPVVPCGPRVRGGCRLPSTAAELTPTPARGFPAWPPALPVAAVVALAFLPVVDNGFVDWDDRS